MVVVVVWVLLFKAGEKNIFSPFYLLPRLPFGPVEMQ